MRPRHGRAASGSARCGGVPCHPPPPNPSLPRDRGESRVTTTSRRVVLLCAVPQFPPKTHEATARLPCHVPKRFIEGKHQKNRNRNPIPEAPGWESGIRHHPAAASGGRRRVHPTPTVPIPAGSTPKQRWQKAGEADGHDAARTPHARRIHPRWNQLNTTPHPVSAAPPPKGWCLSGGFSSETHPKGAPARWGGPGAGGCGDEEPSAGQSEAKGRQSHAGDHWGSPEHGGGKWEGEWGANAPLKMGGARQNPGGGANAVCPSHHQWGHWDAHAKRGGHGGDPGPPQIQPPNPQKETGWAPHEVKQPAGGGGDGQQPLSQQESTHGCRKRVN